MINFDDENEYGSGESGRARLRLVPTKFSNPLELEAALYVLRMIEAERWHARLLRCNRIRDDDVLEVIGLEPDPDSGSTIKAVELREILAKHRMQLQRRARKTPDALARNIDQFGPTLKLNAAERTILRLCVVATNTNKFSEVFRYTLTSLQDLMRAVRSATGLRLRDVVAAFANNRPLRRSGFLENWSTSISGNPLELNSTVADALLAPELDEERFLRRLVRIAPAPSLSMDDFAHLPDVPLLKRYLGETTRHRKKGVNILLYGAPGMGKTEFGRTLAPALGLDVYEVPNEDSEGDPLTSKCRFAAYAVCQNLLACRGNTLLLFDEIEDVFGSGNSTMRALFGMARTHDSNELHKSWVNETLESNPVPAMWICNSIDAIDPAFLRRFDLIMEFAPANRTVRRRAIDRCFRAGEISTHCAERLASIEQLPPAIVARAARVVRSLGKCKPVDRDGQVERVVLASLKAMGYQKAIPAPRLPEHYDPAFLNTDRDLGPLAVGLRAGRDARLCLYGPPGTGKTAFAHHLGQVIDRPVLVKRGSDLRSMWVGESEKQIAAAFQQARNDGAILVIDEADGFLRDRASAQHSWEVTQVNELLTQMEAFEGIFIASTNLVDTLDTASLRRFDFKVKFDYLLSYQRRAMLQRVFDVEDGGITELGAALDQIERLELLTPGDFANALRQLRVTGEPATPSRLVALLSAEVGMKPEKRQRPIGFVTS